MLFNSVQFLVFLPIVVITYFIVPKSFKRYWLLVSSYYFYMGWNFKYTLLLLICTVITYSSGLLIGYIKKCKIQNVNIILKCVVASSFILNLGMLCIFKYLNFVIANINRFFSILNINGQVSYLDIILPVGISFYIFQALSYTIDVYREDVEVEKSFVLYALFVSFFPQLVAGPIEKSKNLLKEIKNLKNPTYIQFRKGLVLMIWGFFMKLVIADRAAIFVNIIYNNYEMHSGSILAIATILFSLQIYCDFAGYSTIAKGVSLLFGVNLMNNFNGPYFASSVSEFWKRWHISLTSWFRDYLYIPLGGNKKGRFRKYINILIVFLTSGIWHGATWNFIIWGLLNGISQIIEDCIKRKNKLEINRYFRIIITFIIINFTWVFFRANSVHSALIIINKLFVDININELFDGSLRTIGLTPIQILLLGISILILVLVDYLKEKGFTLENYLFNRNRPTRWLVYLFFVWFIILFGVYGVGYDASQFIYFQF